MRFIVTARSSTGEIVSEHASLLDARSQGMSMSASGMADVRIADGRGPAQSPADLFRSMFRGDGDGDGGQDTGGAERVALAA